MGKANEVPVAISKANANARKNLIKIPLTGTSISKTSTLGYGDITPQSAVAEDLAEDGFPVPFDDVAEPVDVQHLRQFVAGPLDDQGVMAFLEEDAKALDVLVLEAASNTPFPPAVAVGRLEMKVKTLTAEAPARDSLVSIILDTTKLHYFDSESRCRLV